MPKYYFFSLQFEVTTYNTHISSGQMAERLNAPVLKTGDARAFLSSNLSLSAIQFIRIKQ